MAKPIRHFLIYGIAAAGLAFSSPAAAAPEVLIDHVPAYNWYHGSGPTALGMIFGYYDLHGYDNLFPDVSGWDNVKLTGGVQHHLSSDAHNAYYEDPANPTPPNDGWKDGSGNPAPDAVSIADFFQTSVDPNMDFASPAALAAQAVAGYYDPSLGTYVPGFAGSRGYDFQAVYQETTPLIIALLWGNVKEHINAGRPLLFEVDPPAGFQSQRPDHYVTVVGYDEDRGGQGPHFAFLDTDHEDEFDPDTGQRNVTWAKWQGAGSDWGVVSITFIKPQMQLTHVVALLQTLTDIPAPAGVNLLQVVPDLDRDGRKGLSELIYVLQETAGLRNLYPTNPY